MSKKGTREKRLPWVQKGYQDRGGCWQPSQSQVWQHETKMERRDFNELKQPFKELSKVYINEKGTL